MKLKNLKTNILGRNCIYFKEIDSTQNEVWKMTQQNCAEGSLVMADMQTAGKGTHGRSWVTDEANNIAFSFVLMPNCNLKKLDGLTIKIAKIITEIFKKKYNIDLSIKEPNDVLLNGKKVGGILTETKVLHEKVKYLVVGIGINTNKENFEGELKNIATSIKNECNIKIDRDDFIACFCNKFEEVMEEVLK